jgi:hypothetical protein
MALEDWYKMNERAFKDAKDGERCPCMREEANYEDCCKDWWVRLRASEEGTMEELELEEEMEKTIQQMKDLIIQTFRIENIDRCRNIKEQLQANFDKCKSVIAQWNMMEDSLHQSRMHRAMRGTEPIKIRPEDT